MKLPRLSTWQLVLLVVAVVLVIPGGAIVAVQVVNAIRGRRAVFDAVRLEVERQLGELRPDLEDAQRERAASIVAAQAVVETGGGVTVAWREGYNFGNVTAGASWKGEVVGGGDKEYRADGSVVSIVQRFRRYPTLAAAVSDFLAVVLAWPRYQAARTALYAGDAEGYAARLREGGYYTAPLAEYSAGILAALKGLA